MRILVVGAGRVGAKILRQLKKNSRIEVLTVDPRKKPYAMQEGIISHVNFQEALTPFALERVIERAKPDLILVTTTMEDLGLRNAPGIDLFVEALRRELASIVELPVIGVARL